MEFCKYSQEKLEKSIGLVVDKFKACKVVIPDRLQEILNGMKDGVIAADKYQLVDVGVGAGGGAVEAKKERVEVGEGAEEVVPVAKKARVEAVNGAVEAKEEPGPALSLKEKLQKRKR